MHTRTKAPTIEMVKKYLSYYLHNILKHIQKELQEAQVTHIPQNT